MTTSEYAVTRHQAVQSTAEIAYPCDAIVTQWDCQCMTDVNALQV